MQSLVITRQLPFKPYMRPWMVAFTVVLLCLSGCAGYRSYQAGKSDIADGRLADGVIKLKQASELEPSNTEYRRTYIAQQDAVVSKLVRQAQTDTESGNFDRAREGYAEIQKFQFNDQRALIGLNQVEAAQRHWKSLETASALAEKGDLNAAIAKAQQVISENPNHRKANLLLKRLMRQQADATGKELGIYPKLKATYRTPVSLSFTGASLRQVFEALKLASGLNYMFDKDVQTDARVTIAVSNKPVEDVLRLVLATNQLDYRVLDGDTLLIYPNTASKAADYREMVVRSFYISNADVNKTAAMIKSIAKAKDVFVDERLNLLVVRDSADVVRIAEKLVAAADMVEPEVMLELEVMEVSVNKLLQMGIHWPDSVTASVAGAGGVGKLTLDELHAHSKKLVTLNVGDPFASVQLRNQVGDANILANPRVRVRNRQTAKIMIGDKVPVITVNNTANVGTSESVSYLDVGLKLDIEPTISLDDDVSMKLNLEVSSILDTVIRATGTQTYRIGTRNTTTSLRVRDGETNILAGLIQKEDRRANTGIPVLNELPLVSKLFGTAQDSDSRTEIVLLITPHIIRNLDVPGVGLQEFLSGTESAVGAQPIQLGNSSPAKNAGAAVAPSATPSLPPPPSPTPSVDPSSMPQPGSAPAAPALPVFPPMPNPWPSSLLPAAGSSGKK